MATVTGGGATTVINAGSNDANGVAQALADVISAGLASGSLTRTNGPTPATGAGVLTISTPNVIVADQPNVTVNLVAAGGAAVAGAFVRVSGSGGVNQAVIADNENFTFFTGGGSGTVVTGDGNNFLGTPTVGGGNFSFTSGNGDDIIIAQSGTNTVSGGGGTNFVFTGNSNDVVFNKTGYDIVVESGSTTASTDTIYGGAGKVIVGGFNKNILFLGGSGQSTVLGGAGTYTINGGAGGGLFAGGRSGNNLMGGGTGPVTIFGGGNGDSIFAGTSGTSLLVAGLGNETLSGASSSGNNFFYSTVGNALMNGGAGNDTFFVGSGNTSLSGGAGNDTIAIDSKAAGGTVTIFNFNANERMTLQNYGAGEAAKAIAGQNNVGGSATLKLSDNTTITFVGVGSVNSSNFF